MSNLDGYNMTDEQKYKFSKAFELTKKISLMEGTVTHGTIPCPVCSEPLVWRNNRKYGKARTISSLCSYRHCIGMRGR